MTSTRRLLMTCKTGIVKLWESVTTKGGKRLTNLDKKECEAKIAEIKRMRSAIERMDSLTKEDCEKYHKLGRELNRLSLINKTYTTTTSNNTPKEPQGKHCFHNVIPCEEYEESDTPEDMVQQHCCHCGTQRFRKIIPAGHGRYFPQEEYIVFDFEDEQCYTPRPVQTAGGMPIVRVDEPEKIIVKLPSTTSGGCFDSVPLSLYPTGWKMGTNPVESSTTTESGTTITFASGGIIREP